MMQRSAATADSILADALRTTRATEPALAPGISSLVSSALALLLHVQAAAATPLPADEAILLLESSLAALQPKVRARGPRAPPGSARARVRTHATTRSCCSHPRTRCARPIHKYSTFT
jgi:hypothetical protein